MALTPTCHARQPCWFYARSRAALSPAQLAKNAILLTSNNFSLYLADADASTGKNAGQRAKPPGWFLLHEPLRSTPLDVDLDPADVAPTRLLNADFVHPQDNTTGNVELPDISVAANGDVTITYLAAIAANSKMVTLVG